MVGKNSQQGRDGSTLQQAGRDLIIRNGVSASDALEIAKHVVQGELTLYESRARQVIDDRLHEFREELVERIVSFSPEDLNAFADPDVQAALLEAQKAYARSGRVEVKRSLIDLISARCSVEAGNLQAVVINQAIETVQKVTSRGIIALALGFVVTHVVNTATASLEELTRWFAENFDPFCLELPELDAEFDHLTAVGCTYRSPGEVVLTDLVPRAYPGLFQAGLDRNQISTELFSLREGSSGRPLFISCLNDPEKLQVGAISVDVARSMLPVDVEDRLSDEYTGFLMQNLMSQHLVAETLVKHDDRWTKWISSWDRHPWLKFMRLTSVGIAIGHCYWSNRCDESATLDIWVPRSQ